MNDEGWMLSPAYDLSPSIDRDGLALNIDMHNNALDFDLAKSVGEYFRLNDRQMNSIIAEVLIVVKGWESISKQIGGYYGSICASHFGQMMPAATVQKMPF